MSKMLLWRHIGYYIIDNINLEVMETGALP